MYCEGSTHKKGDRTTMEVSAALVRYGLKLLLPYGAEHRYDIVVDHDGVFIRIQCKSARLLGGCLSFATSSTSYGKRRRRYHDEADFFGVYSELTDKVYFYPVENTGTQVQMRLAPAKNGQSKRVKLAVHYESSVMLAKIFARVAQTAERSPDKGQVESASLSSGTNL